MATILSEKGISWATIVLDSKGALAKKLETTFAIPLSILEFIRGKKPQLFNPFLDFCEAFANTDKLDATLTSEFSWLLILFFSTSDVWIVALLKWHPGKLGKYLCCHRRHDFVTVRRVMSEKNLSRFLWCDNFEKFFGKLNFRRITFEMQFSTPWLNCLKMINIDNSSEPWSFSLYIL